MPTVTAEYLGNLRVASTHVASGAVITTDAPVDNNGKGEAFSPTDLCVTALAACSMTIMGIYGQNHNVDVTGTRIEITKTMSASPRRIAAIDIIFTMPNRAYSAKEKASLEHCVRTCPVHLSLHPEVKQEFVFRWSE